MNNSGALFRSKLDFKRQC